MTTILLTFIIAFVFALVLTPVVRWMGVRFGAVDRPSARKVHTQAIPRSGGLAIAVSFFLAMTACTFFMTDVSNLPFWNKPIAFGILGGIVIFAVGFFDDFHRLGPGIKLLFQIFAASLAFYGGIRIETFFVGGVGLYFGILSYFITVSWFLLFINAINLIDGLDGLAAGVAFFASLVMVILTVMQANYPAALEFAALSGALFGFLRYNFNPASVFMGDGGSYFIGYAIAALAIMGSIKSQVGASLLIPLVALGVPIFDAILSPVRRFILGQRLFQPDKGHIHHSLLKKGLSSRRAVLIIYIISTALCMLAIILINLRDEMVSLFLVVVGAVALIIVRKLGYLEYFAIDKLYGWLRDVSDVAGFTHGRRSFLSLQIEIENAQNLKTLWGNICRALEIMHFDRGELHLPGKKKTDKGEQVVWLFEMPPAVAYDGTKRRRAEEGRTDGEACLSGEDGGPGHAQGLEEGFKPAHNSPKYGPVWVWARGHHWRREDVLKNGMLRVEIPLSAGDPANARLVLIKNLSAEPIQPFTLRRVEYLRRSVTATMNKLFPPPSVE